MYDKISDFIKKELTDLDNRAASAGKLSMQEIQYVDLLAHAKKSFLTCDAMESSIQSEEGYSDGYSRGYNDGYNQAENSYNENYRNDGYGARGRGRGARRDSRGRYAEGYSAGYSADSGYNADYQEYRDGKDMMGELHNLMKKAPNPEVKKKYERFISEMEQMM